MEPDDAYWRRPDPPQDDAVGRDEALGKGDAVGEAGESPRPESAPSGPYPGLTYQGPPRMLPPPAGWRLEHVVVPPEPRKLPNQDYDALDAAEERAALVTRVIAITAGLIVLALLCSQCAGWLL